MDGSGSSAGACGRSRDGRPASTWSTSSSLEVVDQLTLPKIELPTSSQGQSWVRLAPWVDLVDGLDTALITENWFVDDPLTATPVQGTNHWAATMKDGAMSDAVSAGRRIG